MDDLAALRLQIEWGADEALELEPVDRLRVTAPAPQPSPAARERQSNPVQRGRVGDEGPPSGAAERALRAAATATTLPALRDAIAGFDGCALRDTAGNLVFAEGDPSSGLLIIGDPPGAAEDRSGTPFAGREGAYLDRMLASIGLDRGKLLLAPVIPWRPPGDRPPSPAELAICLPFLTRLVVLSGVRRLLLMGPLGAKMLLTPAASRRRPRGAWTQVAMPRQPATVPALPTFSPAELLRHPRDRSAAWADLRLLRRTLDADAAQG